MDKFDRLKKLCQLIRYDILTSTTAAKSGHPSSCFSATELMTTLFFGGFLRSDLTRPKDSFNDRVIFSKGHAAPLLYSLYHAAGAISYNELLTLRAFSSSLEGHPTPRFPFADTATGSLGQGLSVGVGMALGVKFKIKSLELKIKREPKIWALLGDGEMAEGQIWEAMAIASYYKLNNLIAIADINRLGQSAQTMLGWDLKTYAKRVESFGWRTIVINDGHDVRQIHQALIEALSPAPHLSPVMILARTIKGKGVSFMEDKNSWHGRPISKEQLPLALKELGKVDLNVKGKIEKPEIQIKHEKKLPSSTCNLQSKYELGELIATRQSYGDALLALGGANDNIVVLDAEVSNSTFSEKFAKKIPDRYFEMFIAEQNMISSALGLSTLGLTPFVSTFAAFLTRGFDQLRMAQYSAPNLKIVGSHCGVSIGQDGPSQMGLEDISMFRSILNSIIFYPADAVSAFKLTETMANKNGLFYLRANRKETPVIYRKTEEFKVGGSKVHKIAEIGHNQPLTLIIAAGVTLHEALKAQKQLVKENINTVVLDCYSIKPIDYLTIQQLTKKCKNIVVVEDHYPAGGLGEAAMQVLLANTKLKIRNFVHLCVHKTPRSGKPEELLNYEEIDERAIIKAVRSMHNKNR